MTIFSHGDAERVSDTLIDALSEFSNIVVPEVGRPDFVCGDRAARTTRLKSLRAEGYTFFAAIRDDAEEAASCYTLRRKTVLTLINIPLPFGMCPLNAEWEIAWAKPFGATFKPSTSLTILRVGAP